MTSEILKAAFSLPSERSRSAASPPPMRLHRQQHGFSGLGAHGTGDTEIDLKIAYKLAEVHDIALADEVAAWPFSGGPGRVLCRSTRIWAPGLQSPKPSISWGAHIDFIETLLRSPNCDTCVVRVVPATS